VAVGPAGAQAFLVAALHRGAQHVGTVVAGAVPAAAVVVAVRRAGAVVAAVVVGAALRCLTGLFGAQALLVGTLARLLLGDAGADLAVVLPCFAAVLAALLLGLAAVLAALLPGFAALLAALLALFLAVLAMLLPVLVAGGGRLGGHAETGGKQGAQRECDEQSMTVESLHGYLGRAGKPCCLLHVHYTPARLNPF